MINPDVDVVVLTWNDGTLLDRALSSVSRSAGVNVHVIVVDNGSSPPAVPSFGLLIRNSENVGVARGRNQGIRAGNSPFVCLLDSDAALHADTLRRLVSVLESDPTIGLAAPVFTGQLPEASAGRAPTLMRKAARAVGFTSIYAPVPARGGVANVDFAIGACQVIRRAAYDSVGGLDDSIFYGPEDVDFCLRLKGAGWHVVQVTDARCDHPPRRRNRRLLTRRGLRHALAILKHHWRHRRTPGNG